jgi:hypothetical protein
MDRQEVSIVQEVQSTLKPVVFVSHQPAGKAVLAALSIAATGLAVGLPSAAMANSNSPTPQPIVFMSQQKQVTAGTEKLQVWEKTLQKKLGMDKVSLKRVSTGTSCTTCCPDADDCGMD